MSGQKFFAWVRDGLGLGLGSLIVLHETFAGPVNLYLTGLAGLLLGVPGLAGVFNLAKGRVSVTLTPDESSSPPSSPSAHSSPSP